jgi:hypothetical protein
MEYLSRSGIDSPWQDLSLNDQSLDLGGYSLLATQHDHIGRMKGVSEEDRNVIQQ